VATRRDRLEAWARAGEILLPDERVRLGEFLDLFDEQLGLVAQDQDNPTVIEVFAARRRTAILWQLDRLTSNGRVMRERVRDAVTRPIARAEHFAEADLDGRLMHLGFEQIEDADRLLRYGRFVSVADTEDEDKVVVPLEPKKRKARA